MSDVTKAQPATSDVEISSKRSIKFTSKGFSFYLKMCQGKRSAKCKQAKRKMEDVNVLMESKDRADSVTSLLAIFIQCYKDAKDSHDNFTSLPIPPDELNKQKYFENKMTTYLEFTDRVKGWLCELGQPYVQPNVDHNEQSNDNVDDEINPQDSASNVSSVILKAKNRSQMSRASSTTSARVKAEAERAALMERAAALKKKKTSN